MATLLKYRMSPIISSPKTARCLRAIPVLLTRNCPELAAKDAVCRYARVPSPRKMQTNGAGSETSVEGGALDGPILGPALGAALS